MRTATGTQKITLFISLILLLTLIVSVPSVKAEEDIWTDEPPERGRRFQLTDERIEQILTQIAAKNPELADKLKRLQKEDSEKFKEQLRAEMVKMRPPAKNGSEPSGPDRMPPDQGRQEGRGRGGPRSARWRERMQKSHEEYIEWLQKNYPEEAEELERLQQEEPEQYYRHVYSSRRKYGRIMDTERRNPELAEILKEDLEIQKVRSELVEQIKQARKDERKELTEKLEDLISRRFDLIVRKKQLQYEDLQKRLEKMQTELKQRQLEVKKLQNTKEKAIKERLDELIGQSEKVKWE
jgi:hypothetical protein